MQHNSQTHFWNLFNFIVLVVCEFLIKIHCEYFIELWIAQYYEQYLI